MSASIPARPDPSGAAGSDPRHLPQLIAYADRFGGSLAGLTQLLAGPLDGAFGGVHVLPFFRPFDGADAGFDPEDHTEVDARLGAWSDVKALAGSHAVMADLIVNHVSRGSRQFRDVQQRGEASEWAPMFLTLGSIFPDGVTEADLARIYRPRPGLPFTPITLGGVRRLVWTTFTPDQIDLDLRHPVTWDYLTGVIDTLTGAGVRLLRLDAVGYTGKQAGTDCFMTPAADEVIARIRGYARQRGAKVLLEIHGHYRQQLDAAARADYVYDFALPPLLLHALTAGDLQPLQHWLAIRPANTVTVLDTHDGIGIIDAGRNALRPGEPGLLDDRQLDTLVETIHANSGGTSREATGAAASNLDLYQVNCTFYDALGADDDRYLLARLIQLFLPGIPQVYYVGLLAGRNDLDLLHRTGVGRDVNRHHYTAAEIEAELARPVVRAQLAALRLRAAHPAFGGSFHSQLEGSRLELHWRSGEQQVGLTADVVTGQGTVSATQPDGRTRSLGPRELASAELPALLTGD